MSNEKETMNRVRLRGRIVFFVLYDNHAVIDLRIMNERAVGAQTNRNAVSNTPRVYVFGDQLDAVRMLKRGDRITVLGHAQTSRDMRDGGIVADKILVADNSRLRAAFRAESGDLSVPYAPDENVVLLRGALGANRKKPNDNMTVFNLDVSYLDDEGNERVAHPRLVAYNSTARMIDKMNEGDTIDVLGFVQTRDKEAKDEMPSEERRRYMPGRLGRDRSGKAVIHYQSFVCTSIEKVD